MRGQILGVDVRTGDGLVVGEDGRRYRFAPADWADRGEPAKGLHVDFEANADRALSVYPLPGALPTRPSEPRLANDRNRLVAAVLAFFLGTLGIHRFYLGRNGTGVLMLVLSITVIGLLLTGPWALVDMARYLIMSDEEFSHRYVRRLR
jgi:TM2 domain-containing membrane protein YozV